MTISELTNNYYLHDSLINQIEYDEKNNQLRINIEFSFWSQNNYRNTDPEVGMIQLLFNDVTCFNSDGLSGEIDYFSILDAISEEDDLLTLNILDDFNDCYYTLKISANSVDFLILD